MEGEALWKSLILNGSIVIFKKASILEKHITNISKEGFDIYLFDCASWDQSNCLAELGHTLNFPDYYGGNLDAFNDCLSDIIPDHEGFVLVFSNFDTFHEQNKEIAFHILDIIQTNAWRLLVGNQKKLIAFLQSNNPELHIQSVGALPVVWNNEEWMDRFNEI